MSSKIERTYGPASREAIDALRKAMLSHGEQLDVPVTHYFVPASGDSGGLYAREITLLKGSSVVGKVHKYAQLNIMSKGAMILFTEFGSKHVKAPYTCVSPPGTCRAAEVLEDTVWTTIHGTNEKDLGVIEDLFVCDDYNTYLEYIEKLAIEEKL